MSARGPLLELDAKDGREAVVSQKGRSLVVSGVEEPRVGAVPISFVRFDAFGVSGVSGMYRAYTE